MALLRRLSILLAALFIPACNRTNPTPYTLSTPQLSFTAVEGGANPADQTFRLISQEILVTPSQAFTASSDQPWLSVSPAAGSIAPGGAVTFTVHVNAAYQIGGWQSATSTVSAPSARWVHSMAWTGSEMVVWGGSIAVAPSDVNTGARYDPVSDTWLGTTTLTGAPSARRYSTAIWDGSDIVTWGGTSAGGWNTGYYYRPDSWTGATTTIGAPGPREAHTAIFTGSEMIIFGGWDGTLLNTGARYRPSDDQWTGTTTTVGAIPRQEHVSVWTGNRMIVWGGRDGVDATSSLNTGQIYDPLTDSWTGSTSTTSGPTGRTAASAVWTGREMIVWGGNDGTTLLDTGARYNAAADTWVAALPTAGAPTGRWRHRAVWTGSKMVVWGGQDGSGMTNTGAIYAPPIPAIGAHTALVTIAPIGGEAQVLVVDLTVTP